MRHDHERDEAGAAVRASKTCRLIGRWRIIKADIWDRDYLDLCGPATIIIHANGTGEITFGAVTASLDVAYSRDDIGFSWNGSDEGDQVEGDGDAEIQDDGSLLINFVYRNGDEAVLTAERDKS
jgi:hypothetical protein